MTIPKTGTVDVPGATLFYRLRGSGPLLLILSGGHGDADTTDLMCDHLSDHYSVLTYDRRGLSRSTIDADAEPPTVLTHADDAYRLLAAVATTPSRVFGSSIGALIALDLAAQHPEQVQVLVAHEPPAWELLPDAEQSQARSIMAEILSAFRSQGPGAALQEFARLAASDHADREPDVVLPQPTPQLAANLNFFFSTDAPSVGDHRLDLTALKAVSTRIVAAGGTSARDTAPYHCATQLAARLDVAFAEFPGGHTGWLLRPKAFAMKLLQVLQER